MTQNFVDIASTDIVGESLDPIKNRDQSVKTNFMGTDFPQVTAADVGMPVIIIKTEYGVTSKKIWRLVDFADNQPLWQLERDLTKGLVYSTTEDDVNIGTYQESNILLSSLSEQQATGSQSNANKFPYLSAKNTFSLASITSLGRSLVAAASASAARTVLGLGSLSTKNSVATSDIGNKAVTFDKLADGTQGKIITYNSSNRPTLVSMPDGVPVGTIMMWPSAVLPDSSWLFCNGQQVSKTTYADLWAVASDPNSANLVTDLTVWQNTRPGSFYHSGSSATVFRIPDLRNLFIRVWDGPTGPTRTIGNKQTESMGSHRHYIVSADLSAESHGGPCPAANKAIAYGSRGTGEHIGYRLCNSGGNLDATIGRTSAAGSTENRPTNVFLPFIIKAKPLSS